MTDLVNVAGAAELANVKPDTIHKWVRRRKLHPIMINGRRWYLAADVRHAATRRYPHPYLTTAVQWYRAH